MANLVFNVAKGRFIHYAALAEQQAGNEALLLVVLGAANLPNDDTLQDYATLAAVLGGAASEVSFTGYNRPVLANVTVSVDNTGNKAGFTADPITIINTDPAVAAGKALVCFDPDTTAGTDADIIPLAFYDAALSFDTGVPVTFTPDVSGLAIARNPN